MDNITFSVSVNRLFAGQKLGMPPEEKRWANYNSSFHQEDTLRFPCLQRSERDTRSPALLVAARGCTVGSGVPLRSAKKSPATVEGLLVIV
jgi:hypothetical protein